MGIFFALLTLMTSWLAFLVICFGALCAGIGGSKNASTLMALRFLLGASEAGVYPGMIFFLSFWYGPRERAIRIAVFLCSATLAGAFGGMIIPNAICQFMDAKTCFYRCYCLRSSSYEWCRRLTSMAVAFYYRRFTMSRPSSCHFLFPAKLPGKGQLAHCGR